MKWWCSFIRPPHCCTKYIFDVNTTWPRGWWTEMECINVPYSPIDTIATLSPIRIEGLFGITARRIKRQETKINRSWWACRWRTWYCYFRRSEWMCKPNQTSQRSINSPRIPLHEAWGYSVADIAKPTLNPLSGALGVSLVDIRPIIAHLTALFCWGSETSRQP